MAKLTFSGTIQRGQFIMNYVLLTIITIALTIGGLLLVETAVGISLMMFALIIPIAVYTWMIATQRTRDTGLSPYLVLLLLIPYVNFAFGIFLMVAKTDAFKE